MIHKTFTVDGTPDIDVRIESGRIEVHRSSGSEVDVKVDTKLPGFIVEQRGNSILVSSDKDSWLSRGSAYVIIETPPASDLNVSVASAPVYADVELGKADIKTASGDVEIEQVETLSVKTASGDLNVRAVERALAFVSASGDLRVAERAAGSVVVSTASGDVHIDESDATISMNTASGDAYIRRFTGRTASFKGMSGTIDLGIPSGTDVELDVNLLSGKLRVPDPEPRKSPPLRRMAIKAKLVSGDLNITRA